MTRGGGSLEDLWAFNEEVVARAIYESALPVVSAVGHEIDFTISDFVADVRAATPSAAAEVITEGVFASRQFIADVVGEMRQRVRKRLESEGEALTQLGDRLRRVHPRRRLNERLQQLDDLQASLARGVRHAGAVVGRRETRISGLFDCDRRACSSSGAKRCNGPTAGCASCLCSDGGRTRTVWPRRKPVCACSRPSRCLRAGIPLPPTLRQTK